MTKVSGVNTGRYSHHGQTIWNTVLGKNADLIECELKGRLHACVYRVNKKTGKRVGGTDFAKTTRRTRLVGWGCRLTPVEPEESECR